MFRWPKREFLLVRRVTWQVHFSIFHDRYVVKLKWIEEDVVFSSIKLVLMSKSFKNFL